MQQKWFVRKYKDGDEEGIFELWKVVYPEQRLEREVWMRWWNWWYKENPAGMGIIWVAEHDAKIVGHDALIPARMKVGNKTVIAALSVDTMTHPDFTRQGMFVALAKNVHSDAAKNSIRIIRILPNKASHHGFMKLGCFDIATRQIWIKPFNWRNSVKLQVKNRLLSRVLAIGGSLIFNKILIRVQKPAIMEGVTVSQLTSFDDRINELWNKVADKHEIIYVRDKDYLNWRYVSVPDVTYSIYIAERAGEICGYLVSRIKQWDNTKLGVIFDVLTESVELAHCLLSMAVEQFEYGKADLAFCRMIDRKTLPKALKSSGFISLDFVKGFIKEVPFGVCSCASGISEEFLKDPQNWFIQVGDSGWI